MPNTKRPATKSRVSADERACWMAEVRRLRNLALLQGVSGIYVTDTLIKFGKGRVKRVNAKPGGLGKK